MEKEIIVAIITASGGILVAIIAGIFSLFKKVKRKIVKKFKETIIFKQVAIFTQLGV